MPLPLPNLDDRDFRQLMAAAMQRLRQTNTSWDDLSPGDPGIVLLELFAYLTDSMIYRLNQIPDRVYIVLLRLLGVSLYPPAAASVTLRFSRARGQGQAIEIPRGTRVTVPGGSGGPVFTTLAAATLAADAEYVDVVAYQAEQSSGELIGSGSGAPGLALNILHPPIIRPTGDPLDLIVAVETPASELEDGAPAIQHDGATYRIWREVANFANPGDDRFVYVADRATGTITFAPAVFTDETGNEARLGDALLGEVPPAGRAVRVWYRWGGGSKGNVAANTLTTLKDAIPGLQVTNPAPATGGREAETLENALLRGPKALHSLERAVTAGDFELVALRASGVARARAFTYADLWRHAARGTVSVLLVPDVPTEQWSNGHLPLTVIEAHQSDTVRQEVQASLDARRALGTACLVQWARYKTVRVSATIVVRREENADAVRARVLECLNRTINPLASDGARGWPFGQSLRVSHVYDVALSEPGVRWVENIQLQVQDVPLEPAAVAADAFQPATWYAASGSRVFRSLNDGAGWEVVLALPDDERVETVRTHSTAAGMVAASARVGESEQSRVYVSRDCGETWERVAETEFHVEELAWMQRDRTPVLLLATDAGLFELVNPRPQTEIVQVLVNPRDQAMAFYAVAVSTDLRGAVAVAVAAQNSGGVFLSSDGGQSNTFRPIKGVVDGKDVRVLAVQTQGARAWLWAGTFAFGEDTGSGCYRWELRDDEDPVAGWEALNAAWTGGSCRGLAFVRGGVLAATHRGGVMFLNPDDSHPAWQPPDVNAGLLVRDLSKGWFATVDSIAANPDGSLALAAVLRGGERGEGKGVYRADDSDATYQDWKYEWVSKDRFTDVVTLPSNWLFASGDHEIIVTNDETR